MSTEATIRAGGTIRWSISRRQRSGEPAGPGSYAGTGLPGPFAPISLELAMAPAVARLRFSIEPDSLAMPWRWGQRIALDDMVELTGDQQGADRVGLFSGFVVEPEWNYQAGGGECIIVAVGRAQRLMADTFVYGRWMLDAKGDKFHATGLACDFNAGGRPNRDDRTTAALFTYDGNPDARWWSATDAMRYLTERYNTAETWLSNPSFTAAQQDDTRPITARVEGLSLWQAMALAASAGGYDVWEHYAHAGGVVTAAIRYQHRSAGPAYEIRHQKPAASYQPVSLQRTTSFAARVAESVASSITAPIILGARKLTQLTVELYKCWPATANVVYDPAVDGPMILENDADSLYAWKYIVGGPQFDQYMFTGRRWDANTDLKFAAIQANSVDMGLAIDGAANSWPAMPHRPLPLIDRDTYGRDIAAYWTPDGGANNYELRGYQVYPDRLAIYITQPNLADIRYGDKADKATKNFFYVLANSPTQLKVFLICTVASPTRAVHAASRRAGAGTAFTTARAIDRGQAGGIRSVKPDAKSPWYAAFGGGGARTADDSDDLARMAQQVLDAAEDRFLEASLELPWPESAIHLGDRVERIAGIDYRLGANGGAATRSPRVVRLVLNLTPATYDTQIVLDTDRMAGVL